MLFNSINFAIFLPIVFSLYWFLKRVDYQNKLLLSASYLFYACWDYKFLFLLIFSTFLDYYTGLKIDENLRLNRRKIWLWTSIIINLSFLGIFKYYNFFIESFASLLALFNIKSNFGTLQVILPVGISFYTFHGLSYVIDIYNKRIKSEKNFIDYSLFVSFFPLLVAGPIERATHLLPQIKIHRYFNYTKSVDGIKQILWGLFKKIVIADNCAIIVNVIFNNYQDHSGSTLMLGAVFFSFQIYCDFSGYSDIALGTARILGFELLQNFSFPYFSRDIAEFWRRWHISLSSWFKDYLYIPLGGSKGSSLNKIRNTLIIFLVSGFWHGANWTFIIWGLINALYIIPSILFKSNRQNINIVAEGKYLPSVKEFFSIILTFCLTTFAWIFFRSENIESAVKYITKIFSPSILSIPAILPYSNIFLIILFLTIEWLGREGQYALAITSRLKSIYTRVLCYYLLILIILIFGNFSENQFIYFQF